MKLVSKFVKSGNTGVPVGRSQAECEKVLRRYGATGFGVLNDYEQCRISVQFRVPDSHQKDAGQVPVRLDLDTRAIYDALYGQPTKRRWEEDRPVIERDLKGYRPEGLEQSERVAWRQLILWIDAACSSAATGMQTMSEAFFAHTLIRTDDGKSQRLIDHLDQVSNGGWRAMLGPGLSSTEAP